MVFVNNFYFNKVSEIYYVALDLELRRSPGERNGYPLQYSGLENSMDSIVHGVTKNQTQLSNFHFLSTLQTDGETKETMTDFTFLGSKITADGQS